MSERMTDQNVIWPLLPPVRRKSPVRNFSQQSMIQNTCAMTTSMIPAFSAALSAPTRRMALSTTIHTATGTRMSHMTAITLLITFIMHFLRYKNHLMI